MFDYSGGFRWIFPIGPLGFIYLHSGLGKGTFSGSSERDSKLNIVRFTLVALILSMVWLVFNPVWFPQAELKYDFMRIFFLGVALLATIIAYLNYRRMLGG